MIDKRILTIDDMEINKMKKVICIIVIISLLFILTGCGNHSIGFGNYQFNKIHVSDCSGNCIDLTVLKWYEDETGIEVDTEEVGPIFCSEGTYIMLEDKCPICDKK